MRRGVIGIAVAGMLLRLLLVVRDITVLDRLFVPDDTYYTLAIARGMARGWGPSVDGIHLTNGFQPLIAFLVVPAFWVSRDPMFPLRVAWTILALADVASAVLLARLAMRAVPSLGTGRAIAAWAACALWSLSPVAIANAMGGLETSLAVACELACVEVWCVAREKPSRNWWLLAGVLSGLGVLARIDSAIIFIVLAIAAGIEKPRAVAWAVLGSAVVVAPWWAYELVHFGTVIPSSGQAVRTQVAEHRAYYLTSFGQLGWALGAALEPWVARLADLRLFFYRQTWLTVIVAPVGIFGSIFAAWRSGVIRPVLAFLVGALALFPFYAFYVPALWFFPRYLAPVHAALTLLVAIGLAHAFESREQWPRRWFIVRGAVLIVFALSGAVDAGQLLAQPDRTPDEDLHGAKGYREPAMALMRMIPPGAVIGALQSGALSYFAAPGVRVLNLDGVIDNEARIAFRDNRMADFVRANKMTYFADWEWNREAFLRHTGDPRIAESCLVPIGGAPPQPPDRFVLYSFVCP